MVVYVFIYLFNLFNEFTLYKAHMRKFKEKVLRERNTCLFYTSSPVPSHRRLVSSHYTVETRTPCA